MTFLTEPQIRFVGILAEGLQAHETLNIHDDDAVRRADISFNIGLGTVIKPEVIDELIDQMTMDKN